MEGLPYVLTTIMEDGSPEDCYPIYGILFRCVSNYLPEVLYFALPNFFSIAVDSRNLILLGRKSFYPESLSVKPEKNEKGF